MGELAVRVKVILINEMKFKGTAACLLLGVLGLSVLNAGGGSAGTSDRALTFGKDVAPIVFRQCSGCHRPGQSAPFSLLRYADLKKQAKEIAEVTARRYMPPWLPADGFGDFAGARRLTDEELAVLQKWIAQGAVEGDASDLPSPPK